MNSKTSMLVASVATLIGIIIGAGYLGIPKAITIAGLIPSIAMMIVVSIVMFFMCLFATELALNTKKVYQMPGMIGKYWNKKAGWVASITFALISFGAMCAYFIASSEIISTYTGLSPTISMTAYFIFIFFLVLNGLKLVEKAEIYLGIAKILFLIILLFILSPNINTANLTSLSTTNLLIPLGVFIFSFSGYNVMAQIEEITNGDKKIMIQASIISLVISLLFFAAFGLLMVGVFGEGVKSVATENLTGIIGVIGNAMALFSMTGSCIMSGLLWRDMLVDDYGVKKWLSSIIATLVPFLFTLFISPSFIDTLAFTGAVLSGLFAILLCITVVIQRKKIRTVYYKTPGGIITPIIVSLFFIIGIMVLFV
ncbi:Tryptophan/tyrosine permease family protein [Candidatus Tiddalikarchaeum anstoanum]|nr:Tryptophan/tyrosine permease family protein [Candidatus Tiddalikarchaeum anstoanum]